MTEYEMTRAFILLLLDSFGLGALPDAAGYGDAGADTLGHIPMLFFGPGVAPRELPTASTFADIGATLANGTPL
jgi:phosphopentomutase